MHAENLTKVYRVSKRREGIGGAIVDLVNRRTSDLTAVDNVSFSLARGEMVGYIGANGAGKSTTIKMLSGILTPTSGDVTVNGWIPWKQRKECTRTLGAVFGQRTQLWWDIAVVESFKLLKRIYEIPDALYNEQLETFDGLLGIGAFLHQPVRTLSLGQRMRCDLAAALLHRPSVLFLDEPTIGLDVVSKENIRRFLKGVNEQLGTTVVLTTHDLDDIEQLCKRVIVIDEGKLLYDGELEGLKRLTGHIGRLRVEIRGEGGDATVRAATAGLAVEWERIGPGLFEAEFRKDEIPVAELVRRLVTEAPVHDLSVLEPPVEEVVQKIYRGEVRIP
ncbi:MAG: ATP-binding cassette domain-containing protein [Gemmatimonadetes bacterium]|nr:ATP-binding cassette domain-containing protein [Gemmatimonadota bacterium]